APPTSPWKKPCRAGGAVSAGRMLGPLAGGALYDRLSPPVVLGAAAVVSATACACFDLYRALARRAGTGAGRRSAR
ncbi:MAG: MFS transporter, partial [Firmicutes bacterium]|nr:MFS transporter [Bacillota bacterium]